MSEGAAEYQPHPDHKPEEQPVEIKRFTQEAREALEGQGYVIYGLTGQSIKMQKDNFRPINYKGQGYTPFPQDNNDFEVLTAMHSEVAINPKKLFLPNSYRKNLAQHEEMVDKFSQRLGKKVPGVKAIIGQAPDYVELTFQHLSATGQSLFGKEYKYDATITETPTDSNNVARVGEMSTSGLVIGSSPRDEGNISVRVAPLVVPV